MDAEYERRKELCDLLKDMQKSEFVEIARILRKNKVALSENRSGLFFDMAKLPDAVFEELLKFYAFVQKNNTELEKREPLKANTT